jgi:hypothetical protein
VRGKPRLFIALAVLISLLAALLRALISPNTQHSPAFVGEEAPVTRNVAVTLWGFRQLDILAVAFLVFGAAVCCSALVGEEEPDL